MEKCIFGATDGIREHVGNGVLRPNKIQVLGFAIAEFFKGQPILLARDTRESGIWIIDYLKRGIEEQGGSYKDLGVMPTPAIAKVLSCDDDFKAGIMVTASHNPASDNGIKVFFGDGDKIGDEEELAIEARYFKRIETNLEPDIELPEGLEMSLECDSGALDSYCDYVAETLGDDDLSGFKVILDAACGAAHEFSKEVLRRFGVEFVAFDKTPNGQNINVDCGALYPEHVAAEAERMHCVAAALDGDADRVMLADEQGRLLDGDRMVALLSRYLSEQGKLPGNAVVMTEYSNLSLALYLQKQGVELLKVVNGDRNVSNLCREKGLPLGGEMSGHIIYMPWLMSSDGTFMTLLTLKMMKDKKCSLAELYPEYELTPSKQWGVRVREKRPLEKLDGWTQALAEIEAQFAGKGRVFTRYSGTENKLRILVEAEDMAAVETAGERLARIVTEQIGE